MPRLLVLRTARFPIHLAAVPLVAALARGQELAPHGSHDELSESIARIELLSFEAPARAVELAERTLSEARDVPRELEARLRLARCESLGRAGRFDESLRELEGLALWNDLDPRLRGRVLLRLAGALVMQARADEGRARLAQARPLVEAQGSAEERAALLGTEGVLCQTEAHFAQALRQYRLALEEAQRARNPRLIALYLYNIGTIQCATGEVAGARESFERALQLELGRGNQLAMLYATLGGLEEAEGDGVRARQLYEEALAMQRELGSKSGEAYLLRQLGELEISAGHTPAAVEHFTGSVVLTRELGNREAIASSLVRLADAHLSAGRPADALPLAEEAHALAAELDMPVVRQHVAQTLSGACARLGQFERALETHREYSRITARLESEARSAEITRLDASHRLELERRDREIEVAREKRTRNAALGAAAGILVVTLILVRTLRDKARWARALEQRNAEIGHTSARLEELNRELERALADVRLLSGLLPICAYCKSIRDEHGRWQRIEAYFSDHSQTRFSHSICPACLGDHHADLGAPVARG